MNDGNFFIAEVRDHEGDPWKSGRVKVRVYGKHDNEQDIPDDDLPWAMPIQPVTSASTNRIGGSPHGMLTGSRVFGMYLDEAQQYPVILGTFSRAGKLKDEEDNTGGKDDIDEKYSDVPLRAQGKKKSNTQAKKTVDKQKTDPTEKSEYNKKDYVSEDDAEDPLDKSRSKYAEKTADLKTVGGLEKSDSGSILSKIQQVDPSNEAGALPQAPRLMQQLLQTTNMTNMGGMGGTNGMMGSGMGGIFGGMANEIGIGPMMGMLSGMLGGIMGGFGGGGGGGGAGPNGGIYGGDVVDPNSGESYTYYVPETVEEFAATASDILNMLGGFTTQTDQIKNLSDLDRQALYTALLDLMNRVTVKPNVTTTITGSVSANVFYVATPTYGNILPTNNFDGVDVNKVTTDQILPPAQLPGALIGYESVPDGYFEVFTFSDTDPWPGYIQWEGPAGELVFTPRPSWKPYTGHPEYDTINAGIYAMLDDLTQLVRLRRVTTTALTGIMANGRQATYDQGTQNATGKGTNNSNIMNMLQQLLGMLGQLIQQAQQNHLPESVLDKGSMQETLQNYSKKGSDLRRKKKLAKQAVESKNQNSGLMGNNGMLGFGNIQDKLGKKGTGGGNQTGVNPPASTQSGSPAPNQASNAAITSVTAISGVTNTPIVGYYPKF